MQYHGKSFRFGKIITEYLYLYCISVSVLKVYDRSILFYIFYYSGLDEAAMRAVAALLKGLPLQPENIENDITEAKSNLFLKQAF